MADNVPIHNQITVDVRLKLNDPTQGADNGLKAESTAFKKWSPEQINHYVNNACRAVVNEFVRAFGVNEASEKIQCVKTQSITFSSSGTAVNKDYLTSLRLIGTSEANFTLRNKADLDNDVDTMINRGYAIHGGKIYGYIRASGTLTLQNSGTATLHYIFAERKDSNGADVGVNTTPDIIIEQAWHEAITNYAVALAYSDVGDEVNFTEMKAKALSFLPKPE